MLEVSVTDTKIFVLYPLHHTSPLNRRLRLTFLRFVFIPGHYVPHFHPFPSLGFFLFYRVCN